ncbi:hypothetical protein Tco_0340750 [Tanacetum coccineum]
MELTTVSLHHSGQVENTNRALKRILKFTIKDNPAIWSRKLDDTLYPPLVPKIIDAFSLFELRSEQSYVSIPSLWMCICGFVAFSGAMHVPVLANTPFSAKLLKHLSKKLKFCAEPW